MANSDISVPSVDHRQEPSLSPSTTFSIYGLAAVSITYLRSILAPILGHQMEHVSKIDRRTTKHGARFRITVPEDRQRNIIQRLERQSKQTHWRIRQNYRHRRPDQPRPTAPPPPLSRQILAVNVANISNKSPAIRHIVRNTRLWAISETCITSSKFRFTVPGFDVIQHPATGPGRRGIALGIPSCFGGHEHGSAVGTMILAKVPNFTPECLWIVGSVYVGHSGATTNYSRREAFSSIRQALDRVVPFDNNHPVLIFGDWNTDPQRLQRIVHSWGHGLTVMQFSGSQITRLSTVRGRRHSSIDHFVCNASARALLTSPRVDRQTAVADHFVIRTSIRAEAQGQPPAPRAPTISRHHCLEATDRIATSNYWDVLADGAADNTDTDTDIHQLTSQFLESANAVADNLSLRLSPPATRSNHRLLSGATKRAILASNTARQAFIAAATHTNLDPVHCNTFRDEWSRLKAAATQLKRADGRKQWVKHADNLDHAVSDGRTDLVFAAARAMSGNSSRSAAVTPLYNSDGIVQYDPTSILRVMQGHYGSLAADTTGHSLDLQYWHDRQPIQISRDTPSIRNSDILDQDFSWNQIAAALLQMSPRKAPGDDGITTAFYQAALYMPANTQEGVPPTPFARALLRVCGQVFASATIPRAWLCASIVSIDKKDGDPLNPGNKRGIALINVGLKLVCKVLQMRIERFVETNNLLSYEQAGFRKREECVGQVVSLVDIIQRRQNAGLNTHVLFIDIRKAFDTVPVGALLWKLQNMGFPRRTLAFLKALYTSSSARARAGSLLSDPFPVQRGVRQGCPLSGLLFNLFINDILDGVAPITVPGLPRDTNPIRGLMYADDVAVFADSEQSLLATSTAVEQWANQWEMQFGVAKCGIISFTGHLAPRLDNPLEIRLHGQLVSRVESYKYLGVLIDSKLDHSAWLKQKWSALEHTISALHPVLANHQLTVNYRSRIFSAVVMGKAYYGIELVGGNKSHLAPLQTTINKGIRLFTGARLSTAIGPLLVETGIGSLLTRSLVSRVRLLERSVTKRTPINAICSGTDNDVFTLNVQGRLVRSQRWFWSRRTKQLYRNRYWLTPQVRPKTVKQRHSFALMETLQTCGDSASLQKYVTRQLLDTSGFFKDPTRKAIQIGILVDTHPFSVDRCILCEQQLLSTSIAHLVVECEQVTGHRIQSGLVPAIQKSRLRLLGRALDPGVENVYTWLRGGVLNGEADLNQRWLDGTVEHESMGTRHDNRALAARLADFLQCGIISFTGHLAPRLDNPLDIRLHGQLVSRVESYKYLGVLIDSKLDHSAWLKQKRSALEHTISALHPVLANHQLTVNYRSRIFSAVVMDKAYYGLELVGGNKSHLAPLQTTINKGIRLFTGARLSTAIGPLLVETGIGSLLTRSLVSRVRLLERSVTKKTPINAICSGTDNDVFTLNVQGQLVRSQRWFWSRRTKQLYRNRYWLTPQVRPKTVKQRHSFALMETLQTCGDSASLQKYVTRQLLDTSGFFKDPSFDQSRAHGTRYLMLARMDALWTARKAIQIGILVDTHPFSVDHCILCDQQLLSTSIAHLVVECEQVTGHRIQSGLVPAIQKSRLRLLGRALDPGVENVYTWLRGGVLNGEADPDQRWLDGTVEHESMGTRHDNRALAARLADFLQVAYRQYQSTLWKYHRDRIVEVG
ncbi:hypothetical protein BASA83_005909 [Batrachochytrium salamandrivorans]|nr:hypothetical protein BASA83_005909 [Batrachochytrium salamandrivorans]